MAERPALSDWRCLFEKSRKCSAGAGVSVDANVSVGVRVPYRETGRCAYPGSLGYEFSYFVEKRNKMC